MTGRSRDFHRRDSARTACHLGPEFKYSEAFSFQITTNDQQETDRCWNAIVGNGGQERTCGWCNDKWGVSWQNTPRVLTEALVAGGDELLRSLWRSGVRDFEVLRAEVDRAGYDLALECRDVFRHIQLKSSHRDAATRSVNVHLNLVAKPSGCVIWIAFDEATLELGPFYWLGSVPGMPLRELGERVARQNRPNLSGRRGERPDLRTVRRAQFKKLATLAS